MTMIGFNRQHIKSSRWHMQADPQVKKGGIFILFTIGFLTIGKLPYFNLVFTKEIYSILILGIIYVLIFRPTEKVTVLAQIILIAFALVCTLLGLYAVAEGIGNALYVFFIYLVVRYVRRQLSKKQKISVPDL